MPFAQMISSSFDQGVPHFYPRRFQMSGFQFSSSDSYKWEGLLRASDLKQ